MKAEPVEKTTSNALVKFVEVNVESRSTVYTDKVRAYIPLPNIIDQYDYVKHSEGEYVHDNVHTNNVESVWAVLKRSINGTWHHVFFKHLGQYVNEVIFRLNEGNHEVDTIDRIGELAAQIDGKRLRYVDIIADNGKSAVPVELR